MTPVRGVNVSRYLWSDGILLMLIATLYLIGLAYSPVYLLNDEVFNALQALSLAHTGRSLGGDFLPVYFRGLEFPPGRDPLCVYGTALALKVFPLTEGTIRLPTALMGVTDIVLAYFIGWRLWHERRWALLTAAAVAFTPGHYINSRVGIPTLWSMPWLLGWCLCLLIYLQERRIRALVMASLCLGISTYGYLGTAVLVPLYAAGTLLVLFYSADERRLRIYAAALAATMLPLIFIAYWHVLHPERWRELADYYLTAATVMREGAPLLSPDGLPNFAGIQDRVTAYWNYFNPTLLFLSGDESPRYSTGRAGVYLWPAAVLLPVGIYRAAHIAGAGRFLVFCLVIAPVGAALTATVQVQRALPLVVFGALLCAWGAVSLFQHESARVRRATLILCLAGAAQFGLFLSDYFGHYRLRSGAWRGGNLRGAFERVIATSREHDHPVLYLDDAIDNVDVYWRFYAAALGAGTLSDRAVVVAPSLVTDAPVGALFITGTQKGFTVSPADAANWHLRERIYELDGPTFFSIFEKIQ